MLTCFSSLSIEQKVESLSKYFICDDVCSYQDDRWSQSIEPKLQSMLADLESSLRSQVLRAQDQSVSPSASLTGISSCLFVCSILLKLANLCLKYSTYNAKWVIHTGRIILYIPIFTYRCTSSFYRFKMTYR